MKKILITSIATLSLLSLVGCSQNSTKSTSSSIKVSQKKDSDQPSKEFKEEVKEAQKVLDEAAKSDQSPYSSMKLVAENKNTLSYTLTLADKVDKGSLTDEGKKQLPQVASPIFKELEGTVKNLKLKFVLLNPDKTEVYSTVITQKDVDRATSGKASSED